MREEDDKLKEKALAMLSEKRFVHTQGVRKTAAELCSLYEADPEKADLAVCCHDIYRGKPAAELDRLIDRYGLDEKYKGSANLAHGKIAAVVMREEFGIKDEDVLNAVSFHTTGRAGMRLLEKIVFLADAIEPGRDYPSVGRLRALARKDLDRACYESLEGTIRFLESQGVTDIDEDTVRARDWLAESLKDT